MIDGAHAGREPEPIRRVHGHLRVENDRIAADLAAGIEMFHLAFQVDRRSEIAELGPGKRCRNDDLPHRRAGDGRRGDFSVTGDLDVVVVEALDGLDVFGKRHQHDLDGVDGRARRRW